LKPPKSGEPRTFPLPESAVEALKIHRERQQENRRFLGKGYRTDLDLVFATVDGNYLRPDSVTAAVCLVARKCGLPGISLHSLRHSHGSQLLSEGVPLPVVSKRLGHANPSITARIYSHALPGDEIRAAEAWDNLMRRALGPKPSRSVAQCCARMRKLLLNCWQETKTLVALTGIERANVQFSWV
jgi:integrase